MNKVNHLLRGNLESRNYSIIRAAINNDIDEAKLALEESPESINDQDDRMGVTALHIAAGNGNMSMVEFLIKQPGCDPFIEDFTGRLPGFMAMVIGRLDISNKIGDLEVGIIGPLDDDDDEPSANVVSLKPRPPSP